MSEITLSGNELQSYFRQTMDYIFMDKARIIANISASSEKRLTEKDWFFQMHFPGNPLMPGVFQMEMLQQTGGLIINAMEGNRELPLYFYSCKNVGIKKAARPGDLLIAKVELIRYKRGIAKFQGELLVNGELSCEMEFSLIAPTEIVGG